MKDIQQLIKKNSQEGRYEYIFPKTFIDAVLDKESGVTLTDILAMFNMLFLSYNGSRSQTRLQVPSSLRRQGLWVTYVLYDKTVVTEWYNAEAIDDTTFGDSANWRDGSNALVGDISISSDGYWVINGEVTNIKAQGEAGITPILRVGSNNHLQVSYTNGSTYVDVSPNPVFTQFRVSNNKLEQSVDLGLTWTVASDYIAAWFRFTGTTGSSQADNVGKIQISRDNGATWSDLSGEFTNSLHIKGYVATVGTLPSTAVQGDIYGVGPTYDPSDTEHTNPIYQLYVKDSTGWVNNGRFTSIAAGVVQTTGTSTTEVMSQDAVSKEFAKIQTSAGILVTDYLIPDHNYQAGGTMAEVSGWNCLKKIASSEKIYSNIDWNPSARCFNASGTVIDTITINNGETTLPNGTTALGIYWNGSKTYTNKYLISDSYLKYAVESLKGDILIEKGRAEDKEDYLNTKIGYYVPYVLITGHNWQANGNMVENFAWDCCQKLPINSDFIINWPRVSARCFNASGDVIDTIVNDSKGKMTVPEGTVSVGIYWQNGGISSYTDKIIILDNSVTRTIVDRLNVTEKNLLGKKYIKKTPTDLYIVSKLSYTNDIVYHFTKCMANELYTFSEVYLSTNNGKIVGTSLTNNGTLNDAGSDNIGPIQVPSSGGGSLFVGGNHTSLSQGEVVKTAETIQVRIYADDVFLAESDVYEGYVDNVSIEVLNNIHNPLFPIVDETDKVIGYSQELCREKVIYNIGNNNIFVSLSHKYLFEGPETIVRYYGMQSHFKSETGIFTPCGAWDSGFTMDLGTEGVDGCTFNKGDYPDFDTYCQVSNLGYEIDYLMPNDFGSHKGISNNDFIGRYSTTKAYHHLMENYLLSVGSVMNWCGAYIWNDKSAIDKVDDANIFQFESDINGDSYLFICAKNTLSNYKIEIPAKFLGKDFEVVKSVGVTAPTELNNIITLTLTQGAELIIKV